MSDKTRRILMINTFSYLIALILALKVYDVAEVGPKFAKVGLSKVNVWFRNIWNYGEGMEYSKLWYSVAGVLSYVCLAVCCFWTVLFVIDVIRSRRIDGVGTDKNLMATFFLYVLAIVCYFLLRILKVNFGPIIMPGQTDLTCSFPSARILLFIVAMGSTTFHVRDVWSERKKLKVVACALCIAVMLFGIVAQTICGTIWFTDTLGGGLLGITLLTFYSFFFFI